MDFKVIGAAQNRDLLFWTFQKYFILTNYFLWYSSSMCKKVTNWWRLVSYWPLLGRIWQISEHKLCIFVIILIPLSSVTKTDWIRWPSFLLLWYNIPMLTQIEKKKEKRSSWWNCSSRPCTLGVFMLNLLANFRIMILQLAAWRACEW